MTSTQTPARSISWKSILDVTTSLIVLAAAIAVLWRVFGPSKPEDVPGTPQVPVEPISIVGVATKGSPTAPIVIVEFSDFECPFCAKFAREILPQLEKDYVDTGKAMVAFRHLPLSIHPTAEPAARAAECAQQQDQFWKMHDELFLESGNLSAENLTKLATGIHLEPVAFKRCLDSDETRGKVLADADLAAMLEISGTPAFMIGSRTSAGSVKVLRVVRGAIPYPQFQRAVEDAMSANTNSAWPAAVGSLLTLAVVLAAVAAYRRRGRTTTASQ
jgi:protein-disulfide isomerase